MEEEKNREEEEVGEGGVEGPSAHRHPLWTALDEAVVRWGFARWAPSYTTSQLGADAVAALTVATMQVPQAMAYALLAGVPAVYGLWSTTVPVVIYGLITASSTVSPGPVAPTSALLFSATSSVTSAAPQSPEFVRVTLALSCVVGALQLAMAAARLHWVAELLSPPIMSGFSSGAAVIIVASQLGELLGVSGAPPEAAPLRRALRAVQWAGSANPAALALAGACVAALVVARARLPPHFPAAIATMALAIAASWAGDLGPRFGLRTVGPVPWAMPAWGAPLGQPSSPSAPGSALADLALVGPAAAVVAVVNFVQTAALARLYGARKGEAVQPLHELCALGAATLGGSFFSCFAVAGSFTRSSVQFEAGAATPGATVLTGVFMALALLALTPALAVLPLAALAALIVVSARQLFSAHDARELWRDGKRSECAQLLVTFGCTVAFDVTCGLAAGIASALLLQAARRAGLKARFAGLWGLWCGGVPGGASGTE